MVVARLISRVIDLVTMLIFARLLTPTDFGLVAISMTIVLILEAALELPLSQALVRLPEIKPSYYDTAFTLAIIRGVLLCVLVCGIAYPFAAFYHHKALVPLMQVLSIAPAARGMLNPHMAQYAKDLNFKYEFRFELVSKVVAFAVGAGAAILTHSYWAIALCTVAAPVVFAGQSYFVAPYRPKLTLADWRIFSGFLGWISLSQIVLAINWQSDQLLLGKLMRPLQLGLFSAANNVTNIPLTALFSPVLRPLLSAFSVLTDEPARLRANYQTAAAAVVTIAMPLLVGQSAVAGPTVILLLGDKWLGAIPMVHWLALSLLPLPFGMLITPLGMALNETQALLWRNLFQMCIKLPLVIVGALMFGFFGVIAARLISEAITAVFCMVTVRRLIGASVFSQFAACSRSILAVIFMAAVMAICAPWLVFGSSTLQVLAELCGNILVGAVSYTGALLILWKIWGQPPGIEAIALRVLGQSWRRVRRPTMKSSAV